MDVVPVVFGRVKRYFGDLHAQQLLEDSDVLIQGRRVPHLPYRVRDSSALHPGHCFQAALARVDVFTPLEPACNV